MARSCTASDQMSVPVNERWLSRLWRLQQWTDVPLVLEDGRPLEVVYPGRQVFDHGPDFRDALLVFSGDLVRGDVEIHVNPGDWRVHGHHADQHYDRVVLHVVWRAGGLPARNTTGHLVPVLELEAVVAETPSIVDHHFDPAETGGVVPFPCAPHRGPRPSVTLLAAIADQGEERLSSKAARFEAALSVEDPAQVFYAALLEAAGYFANRVPFRALANAVPWRIVAAAAPRPLASLVFDLEALFLGSAGLLLTQRRPPRVLLPEDLAFASQLAERWSALNALWHITPMDRAAWRFARVRPENFPTRRLAAQARLLAPFVHSDLPAVFLGILRSEDAAAFPAALDAALVVPPADYWATHHDFGGRPCPPSHLLGHSRASDIAVNVVLPFAIAYGEANRDPSLVARARAAYRSYPALAENELTRYMARLVLGRASFPRATAALQQGLLHVYHCFCREKRCADCPLAICVAATP